MATMRIMSNQSIAWLNGRFVSEREATISPVDAGFVQGTAVAEQLRTFGGKLFHLEEHLDRLVRSLAVLRIAPIPPRSELAAAAEELVARNHPLLESGDDLGVSIVVTPGPYAGYSGKAGPPTVCLHTYPLQFRFWAAKYHAGQALATTAIEQAPPQCWPPTVKCRSRMHYFLADREAAEIDPAARAVLLDRQGMVTEASTANIVLYRSDRGLITPPQTTVLPGISLHALAELAQARGIELSERLFPPEAIAAADEVFLTSTPFCMLPVTRFNRRPVGGGTPGAVFRAILQAWNELVGIDIVAQAERFAVR